MGYDNNNITIANYIIEGHGIMTYSNGDIYNGDWENNNRHGKGKIIYQDGDIYEGEFENDIK